MITIHQRHRQTDRRTDRQTTCDRNTALCTKVHSAVKTFGISTYQYLGVIFYYLDKKLLHRNQNTTKTKCSYHKNSRSFTS